MNKLELVSQMFASWNRTTGWLLSLLYHFHAMPLAPGTRPWPDEVTTALEKRASTSRKAVR